MALLNAGAGDKGGAEREAERQQTPETVNPLVCRMANVGPSLVAGDHERREAKAKVTEAREQPSGIIAHFSFFFSGCCFDQGAEK